MMTCFTALFGMVTVVVSDSSSCFPGGGFYVKQFRMSFSLILTRSLFLKMLLSAVPWPDSKSGNNFLSIKIPLEIANSQVLKTLEFNLSG